MTFDTSSLSQWLKYNSTASFRSNPDNSLKCSIRYFASIDKESAFFKSPKDAGFLGFYAVIAGLCKTSMSSWVILTPNKFVISKLSRMFKY